MTRLIPCVLLWALVLFPLSSCAPPPVEVSAEPTQDAEIEPVSVTLFGERVLLFMEHPRLVLGEPARFLAHFSVLATGEPVRSGRVVLEIGSETLAVDAPKRDGLFIPEGALSEPGRLRARLTVTSAQATETLDLGEIIVHPSPEDARAAALADAAEEPAGSVPFLMEQQWKIKLLLARAGPAQLTRRLSVPARVIAAEGASALVSAPVPGRLLPPESGLLVRSGERVEAGQEIAWIEPPLTAADAAQLAALALEWDLKQFAFDQAVTAAAPRLRFAESEHERMAQLLPNGLATQQQLDQAERDLAVAQGAMSSALSASVALEQLQSRRADSAAVHADGTLRVVVHAPIAGMAVATGRVLGESVEAGDPLLRVVDGTRLWIEGRVSEFDIDQLSAAPQAVASFPALPARRISVGGRTDGRMILFGPEVDALSRTLVLTYELPNPEGDVRLGMLADLEIAVDRADAGVAIPYEAVIMEQGLPTAYVMLGGELFQRRDLVLGLRDGELVEIRSGVQSGEHVATMGAAMIRMAALSPASFGHGHEH
jgi:RND family efflux transporter MFP subunit